MTKKKKTAELLVREKSVVPVVRTPQGKWVPNSDAVNMLLEIFRYPVAKKHVIDKKRGEWFWNLSGKPPNKKENEDDDETDIDVRMVGTEEESGDTDMVGAGEELRIDRGGAAFLQRVVEGAASSSGQRVCRSRTKPKRSTS